MGKIESEQEKERKRTREREWEKENAKTGKSQRDALFWVNLSSMYIV